MAVSVMLKYFSTLGQGTAGYASVGQVRTCYTY